MNKSKFVENFSIDRVRVIVEVMSKMNDWTNKFLFPILSHTCWVCPYIWITRTIFSLCLFNQSIVEGKNKVNHWNNINQTIVCVGINTNCVAIHLCSYPVVVKPLRLTWFRTKYCYFLFSGLVMLNIWHIPIHILTYIYAR
jgi:hypothetical protein